MNSKPGEVWLADLGLTAKTQPVVIVAREDPELPRINPRTIAKEIKTFLKSRGSGLSCSTNFV